MTLIVKREPFEQCTPGLHQAVCAFVNDIGIQIQEYKGEKKEVHQAILTWELDEEMTKGDYAGKRFNISKFYTLSLGDKANLRKDLQSWRGKAFTLAELDGFDIDTVIGANCMLNVVETDSGKRAVAAIMPLPKNYTPMTPEQKEPSENFMKWIEKKRSEAVQPTVQNDVAPEVPPKDDDLPF